MPIAGIKTIIGNRASMADVPEIKKSDRKWQSDVIVDLIKQYGFKHIALNPGASYRGLHDSLVNYGENDPAMMICNHEKIAVQMAHGYAKATGEPMIAIVHNVVGLLHAPLAIYYAYIDRAPVFIIGATGPMDEGIRRPFIDWIHTAAVQGNAVRDFTKWDYQPGSVHGIPDSFARAYSIMMSEPQGPIYMCYDAGIQEAPLIEQIKLPSPDAVRVPPPLAPDRASLEQVADYVLAAENPMILVEYAGRMPHGYDSIVAFAETVGAGVSDIYKRLNFPNRHPLNLSMDGTAFSGADLVLCLDVRDWTRGTHGTNPETREVEDRTAPGCKWIDIGFADIEISKWAMDYNKHRDWDVRVAADAVSALPILTDICGERIASNSALQAKIADRTDRITARHDGLFEKWAVDAKIGWDSSPITLPRLASEVWDVIQDEDWVLTAGELRNWTRKLWNFDRPYRHPGRSLGTATQFGISLGVALANKGTGRLVVDLQPDGDLMFDLGALWVATKYEIPMLVVMYNNRAYYNDWEHQTHVAHRRGTDEERAYIGMDLSGPEPDFAAAARSMGWWAEGPIEDPADINGALLRAIEQVKAGKPALVDTICQHK
jgi:acetolactate synthase-1/2/3 large subunit